MTRNRGNALIESIVAMLALAPFMTGMVLLGKQLDVKHKTYDALRYFVWERTVWSSAAKSANDITMEALDRSFGHPLTRVSSMERLRADGISLNPLWRDRGRRLLTAHPGSTQSDGTPPVQAVVVDRKPSSTARSRAE